MPWCQVNLLAGEEPMNLPEPLMAGGPSDVSAALLVVEGVEVDPVNRLKALFQADGIPSSTTMIASIATNTAVISDKARLRRFCDEKRVVRAVRGIATRGSRCFSSPGRSLISNAKSSLLAPGCARGSSRLLRALLRQAAKSASRESILPPGGRSVNFTSKSSNSSLFSKLCIQTPHNLKPVGNG